MIRKRMVLSAAPKEVFINSFLNTDIIDMRDRAIKASHSDKDSLSV